jgi:RNA polymerase sigma factor (sigma-70 family)
MNKMNYVSNVYDNHIELTNSEKVDLLTDINAHMVGILIDENTLRKTVIKSMMNEIRPIPEEMVESIEYLVASHYHMILSLSNSTLRQYHDTLTVSDLIYYGVIGIYRGALNFDPDRNEGDINVPSYFWRWIKTYIKKGAISIANPIHLSDKSVKDGTRVSILSMDGFAFDGDDGQESGAHDIITMDDDGDENGHRLFEVEDVTKTLRTHLNPKELYLVSSLYGIGVVEQKSIRELAEERSVTLQMIYTDRKNVMDKLKKLL